MHKSQNYILVLILLVINYNGWSVNNMTNDNCKYEITNSMRYVDANNLSIKPGDTICILAGPRRVLQLKNFHGDSLNYIVIKNSGGSVVVENKDDTVSYNFGISIQSCSYFRFTGTGAHDLQYGIKILKTCPKASGLSIDLLSTNFEIDHIEIANTGFAGIFSISQPTCDEIGNRGNFVQRNVSFHDNYIHNTGGEGMYIGHSFYTGYTSEKCREKILYPHEIHGIRVFNNKLDSCGWDGIQVSCATLDCEIYNNSVTNYGTKNEEAQKAGIQLGAGTTGKCYSNAIFNGSGSGINIFGLGDNLIYNNVIINPGYLIDSIKTAYGIFCDDRATIPGRSFNFINNTIIAPRTDGIRIYSNISANNKIYNNLILRPGSANNYKDYAQSYIYSNQDVKVDISHNYFSQNAPSKTQLDSIESIFKFSSLLPIFSKGLNVSELGILTDFNKSLRPKYGNFDIGAFQYSTDDSITQNSPLQNIYIYPNPNEGVFTIANSELGPVKKVVVYNSAGTKVFEDSPSNHEALTFDLKSMIGKGFYYINIDTGKSKNTSLLIVK